MEQQSHSPMIISRTLLIASVLACFGSSLVLGYNLVTLNMDPQHMMSFLTDPDEVDSYKQYYYTIRCLCFAIGGVIGAAFSGLSLDYFGRRNSILWGCLPNILGGGICVFAPMISSNMLLYSGQFLVGFASGLIPSFTVCYLLEISPRVLRGFISAHHNIAMGIGMVVGSLLTSQDGLNKENSWNFIMLMPMIPSFLSTIFIFTVPESPRYLFIHKRQEDEAHAAMRLLDKNESTYNFIRQLRLENNELHFNIKNIFHKKYQKSLQLACLIQTMYHFSGISIVLIQSRLLLQYLHIDSFLIPYHCILFYVLYAACSCTSAVLMEYVGRRILILITGIFICFSLFVMTISLNVSFYFPNLRFKSDMVSLTCMTILIMSHAIGLGNISTVYVGELFRQKSRAIAYSIVQTIHNCIHIIVFSLYLYLFPILHGFLFLVFALVFTCLYLLWYFHAPETKALSFCHISMNLLAPYENNTASSLNLDEREEIDRSDNITWTQPTNENISSSSLHLRLTPTNSNSN